MEVARGGEGGASSPDKAKLAPGWWLRCARSALNQLQSMAKKMIPNLEDDGQNCGAGGGVGDEEALDHPMKPYALQQKEEAETRRIMEGMEGGQESTSLQEKQFTKDRRSLLLLQVLKETERSNTRLGLGGRAKRKKRRGDGKRSKQREGLMDPNFDQNGLVTRKRVQAAAVALSQYHHRLQGTEPLLEGGDGDGRPLTIVQALLELASRDDSGATAHMVESMAVSVRALHTFQEPPQEGEVGQDDELKEDDATKKF